MRKPKMLTMRLSDDLFTDLVRAAEEDGRSVSDFSRHLLQKGLIRRLIEQPDGTYPGQDPEFDWSDHEQDGWA